MEKLKNDEKAKHANRPDYYNQGCAFTIIGLMFFLLTLETSYKSLTVLLLPKLFLNLSGIIGAGLLLFFLIVVAAWSNSRKVRKIILITGILLIFAFFVFREILLALLLGGAILGQFPYAILRYVPAIIYPLLLIITFVLWMICRHKSLTLPRSDVKKVTYALILGTALFSLGHALWLLYDRYDEGIKIGNTTYHIVEVDASFDYPGDVLLYECRFDYVGCQVIYVADRVRYSTALVYGESTGVLRLQTQRHNEAPQTLYEIHVQQE